MYLSQGLHAVETNVPSGARSVSRTTGLLARRDQQENDSAFNGNHEAVVNGLIRRIQDDDDQRALGALMAEFDWVAVKCARRMYRRGESIEDLEQVAREALLGAVARFDVHRGVAFEAFAWSTAMGVLRHHYRGRWQVRVPRRLQELHLATMHATQYLTVAEGRSPTVDELADHLHADRDDVILALDAGHAYRALSLAESLNDHRGGIMRHGRTLGAPDEAIEAFPERAHVCELLASLPLRQREILVMRFFEGRTQTEIGQSLGISQVHVSRLIRAALDTLREQDPPG